MRLTPFSKFLLVLAIVVGLFFLIKHFLPSSDVSKDAATTEQTIPDAAPAEQQGNATSPTQPEKPSSNTSSSTAKFYYTPTPPTNGQIYGVVQMGAESFDYFAVNIDNDLNWEVKGGEWGTSFVKDGMATPANIREKLALAIQDLINKYGVSGKKIHFLISSGAAKEAITTTIKAELSKMGYFINTVTPEKEGIYAYEAVVPKEFRDNSFMVDIGSGNTKISWIKNGKRQGLESYGSKYYLDKTPDNIVKKDMITKTSQVPADMRTTCFMLGGVPFTFAKKIRTDKSERYTVLASPQNTKAEGPKETAGLNIYTGLVEGSKCDNFVFDWKGSYSIGFLMELHQQQTRKAK